MRERIEALTGVARRPAVAGHIPLHRRQILRRHAELVGLKPNFTILDTDDQLRLIKQIAARPRTSTTSAGRRARWPALIDDWKNRGLTPDDVAGRRGGRASPTAAARRSTALYQERLQDAERRRFRRSAAANLRLFARAARRPGRVSASASATSWSTNTRTPTSSNICGCGCWRRGAATSAASATTTSRSMAGAAPRSTTSCASRGISPARGDPAGAQLPLDRPHSRRRLRPDRPQRNRLGKTLFTEAGTGDKPTVRGVQDGEDEARGVGDEIEAAQRARRRSLADMAILVRAAFQMREFEERFIEIGVPYRVDRRPALLRARGNPRRARLSALRRPARRRSRLRAHLQHAPPRPRRGDAGAAARLLARAPACR